MEMIRWMDDDNVKIMAQMDVSVSPSVGSVGSKGAGIWFSGADGIPKWL